MIYELRLRILTYSKPSIDQIHAILIPLAKIGATINKGTPAAERSYIELITNRHDETPPLNCEVIKSWTSP